jgi:hypothetical protein
MKRKTLRSAADLAEAGLIRADAADGIRSVEARYAIAVPALVTDLINPGDANDPIARQYIPDERELVVAGGERDDPIGDEPIRRSKASSTATATACFSRSCTPAPSIAASAFAARWWGPARMQT